MNYKYDKFFYNKRLQIFYVTSTKTTVLKYDHSMFEYEIVANLYYYRVCSKQFTIFY